MYLVLNALPHRHVVQRHCQWTGFAELMVSLRPVKEER
jgi:hypothetical protein